LAGLAALDDADKLAAVAVGEDSWSLIWPGGGEIGTDTPAPRLASVTRQTKETPENDTGVAAIQHLGEYPLWDGAWLAEGVPGSKVSE